MKFTLCSVLFLFRVGARAFSFPPDERLVLSRPEIRRAWNDLPKVDVYFRRPIRHMSKEHVVPRSYCPTGSSDLHNLWPCERKLNSMRQNYLFTEWTVPRGGADWGFDHKNRLFMPPRISRGLIARCDLYMAVVYGEKGAVDPDVLQSWLSEEPDEYELMHEAWAKKYQLNNNPFVYP